MSAAKHRFEGWDGLRFFLVFVALYLPFSVCTPYLQKLLVLRGFDKTEVGVILGFFECMAVLAPPVWGYLVDRTGRPRLILGLAVLGTAPSFLLFGLTNALWVAVPIAVLFGLFYRSVIPLTDGITFRYLHDRPGDYGRIRIGGSTGFISGVLILEIVGISRAGSSRMILAALVAASLVHMASVLFILPDSGPSEKKTGHEPEKPVGPAPHLRDLLSRSFLCFTFAAFLGRLAMMAYYSFFTLFLADRFGFNSPGLLWIIGPLSEMPVIFFSRRIIDRIGARNFFALGLGGIAVRLIGFAAATQVWMLIPLQLLHSLTFGAFHTASVTYVSRCVPRELQGTAQTTFAAITTGGGGIVGSVLGGYVAQHYGFPALYTGAGLLAIVSLVFLLLTVPMLKTKP